MLRRRVSTSCGALLPIFAESATSRGSRAAPLGLFLRAGVMSGPAEDDRLTPLAAGSMAAGVGDHAVRCRVEALELLAAMQQSGSPCAGLLHDWWWLQSGKQRCRRIARGACADCLRRCTHPGANAPCDKFELLLFEPHIATSSRSVGDR